MKDYKSNHIGLVSTEEGVFVNLVRCVMKGAFKEYNGTNKKYSLKDLQDLVKKARWYSGILDDCRNLGLNANKILKAVREHLNTNSVWTPLPLFYAKKLHWFEIQTFGEKPFVAHRTVIVPPDEVEALKKAGIL
jgi:hypothetical protein